MCVLALTGSYLNRHMAVENPANYLRARLQCARLL